MKGSCVRSKRVRNILQFTREILRYEVAALLKINFAYIKISKYENSY